MEQKQVKHTRVPSIGSKSHFFSGSMQQATMLKQQYGQQEWNLLSTYGMRVIRCSTQERLHIRILDACYVIPVPKAGWYTCVSKYALCLASIKHTQ